MLECLPLKIAGYNKDCYCIKISEHLLIDNVAELRQAVSDLLITDYDIIYIDLKNILNADLAGINEVIHSYYTLKNASKKLILLYKQHSEIEKWVETTGLDKFITTAIVPATI
jgi:anti-anti-sigma factor